MAQVNNPKGRKLGLYGKDCQRTANIKEDWRTRDGGGLMDARRLAVELQLSAKRGTVSGEQVNAVVDALLEMADKLERLEAENTKLREQGARLFDKTLELGTENTKLRELVRESLMDYRQYAEKYGLPLYLSDVNEHLDARLRELGIEASQ